MTDAAASLSLEEVADRYDGKWVLLRVTELDETHRPARGEVVSHGSEKKVRGQLHQLLAAGRHGPYYFFCAEPWLRTGEDLRRVVNEAAEQGPPGAGEWQ